MLLTGQRSFFELNLLDYEHPSDSPVVADRNLLWVAVRSGWQHHQSTATAAALYTHEVERLLNWMQQLILTGRPQPRLAFTEPCLSFECLTADTDEFLIQVRLAYEIAPDWHTDPFSPFWLPVVVPKAKLRDAVAHLAQQYARFPIRQ